MSETTFADAEFSSEGSRAQVRRELRLIVDNASNTRSRKQAIRKAAILLGLPERRVAGLYYDEARRVEAHEAAIIRSCVETMQRVFEAKERYEQIRQDYLANAYPSLARYAPKPLAAPPVSEAAPKQRARG